MGVSERKSPGRRLKRGFWAFPVCTPSSLGERRLIFMGYWILAFARIHTPRVPCDTPGCSRAQTRFALGRWAWACVARDPHDANPARWGVSQMRTAALSFSDAKHRSSPSARLCCLVAKTALLHLQHGIARIDTNKFVTILKCDLLNTILSARGAGFGAPLAPPWLLLPHQPPANAH